MPATSRWWPMAAPARCMRCRWRARSASGPSSFRPRPGCSPPSACCSRICVTISCAPGSRGSRMRRLRLSNAFIAILRARAARPSPAPRPSRKRSRSNARPTCAMWAKSTRSQWTCRSRCSNGKTVARSNAYSTPCMNCATARRRRTSAPQGRLHRQTAGLSGRQVPPDSDLRPRRAHRRQPHQRAGADRGTRGDDGAAARRQARGRRLRAPDDQGGGRPLSAMAKSTKTVARKRSAGHKPRAAGKVDPVVTEIVRNGVIAVTEEMKTNLMRTAYNIIIYEALDFTTGLFTPRGETISIGIGLPMFILGMAETVKAKIRHFGAGNIRPGDIYVTNDSYLTGSHLNHVTLTPPIFHKSRLVASTCCMAHWPDICGILGGMSTDIFSEGLQIPILKYQDRGKVDETVVA